MEDAGRIETGNTGNGRIKHKAASRVGYGLFRAQNGPGGNVQMIGCCYDQATLTCSGDLTYNSIAGEKTHGLNRADDSLKIFA